jgi:predicted RNA-binding Zn-ribbon protein involved in translation (DUF1610 family)
MIETSTDWEDSGFDCDHCGGEIFKRIDHETGRADHVSYQCGECGCQWALGGDVLRIGEGTYCRAAARARHQPNEPVGLPDIPVDFGQWSGLLSKSLWILLALVAAVILLRFGGAIVMRLLLPFALVGVGAYLLVRYGRAQSWW